MRQPTYVNNIGTRVRDMDIRRIPGISDDISMKKAWSMMAELNAVTLPIVDGDNILDGIITINDIATSYMENQDSTIIAQAKTPYRNILETLEAEMVVGDPEAVFEKAMLISAAESGRDVVPQPSSRATVVITETAMNRSFRRRIRRGLYRGLPRRAGFAQHPEAREQPPGASVIITPSRYGTRSPGASTNARARLHAPRGLVKFCPATTRIRRGQHAEQNTRKSANISA